MLVDLDLVKLNYFYASLGWFNAYRLIFPLAAVKPDTACFSATERDKPSYGDCYTS